MEAAFGLVRINTEHIDLHRFVHDRSGSSAVIESRTYGNSGIMLNLFIILHDGRYAMERAQLNATHMRLHRASEKLMMRWIGALSSN